VPLGDLCHPSIACDGRAEPVVSNGTGPERNAQDSAIAAPVQTGPAARQAAGSIARQISG